MFVWQAHEDAVTSLAFTPDSRFLVSAGVDECVKVWEPFTGVEQGAISLQPRDPLSLLGVVRRNPRWLTISRDGTHAAVGQVGWGVSLLNFAEARVLFTHSQADVRSLKSSTDGQSVLALVQTSSGRSALVLQYPFLYSYSLNSLPVSSWPAPQALGISPDGSRIAVGSSIYPWPPGNPLHRGVSGRLSMGNYTADDLAFAADMQHLFALVGGKIAVYLLPAGLFKTKLRGHNGRITAMALTPDGRQLWTASHDATVKCWDTSTLTLDRTYTFQTGGLDCLAVSPDGNVAAVGSGQKGTITVWDLA